jgi:hypothetical protein
MDRRFTSAGLHIVRRTTIRTGRADHMRTAMLGVLEDKETVGGEFQRKGFDLNTLWRMAATLSRSLGPSSHGASLLLALQQIFEISEGPERGGRLSVVAERVIGPSFIFQVPSVFHVMAVHAEEFPVAAV